MGAVRHTHMGIRPQTYCLRDDGDRPVIRFVSGNTDYIETFEHGRLLSHRWSCMGDNPTAAEHDTMRDVPADSFLLYVDGMDLRRGWQWVDFKTISDSHSQIFLTHTELQLNVTVNTLADGTGLFVRWLDIENLDNKPISLSGVSVWSGLLFSDLDPPDLAQGDSEFEIGRFMYRAWSTEGRFAWEPLPFGTLKIEGNRGISGWGPPFFMVRRKGSQESFIGQVGWSKDCSMEFTYDPFYAHQCLSFKAGPAGSPPLRVIAPTETISTARIHLGLVGNGFDTTIQAMHDHFRGSVLPGNDSGPFPPVSYNHWGTIATDMDEPKLLAEIDKAAAIGAEFFIIDAGWFGSTKNNYPACCGDWTPGAWLGHSLDNIVDRIRAKQMRFGLWVAIEMVGNKSAVFSDHPDWIIDIEGRSYFANIVEEGHPGFFMNLDLSRQDTAQWVEEELNRIITEYHVDLLRLDGGPTSYEAGCRKVGRYNENLSWKQCETFYTILDRLRARHPQLMIDNCFGGGGRLDAGMFTRSNIAWISDEYHTSRLQLHSLNGVTLALPPEICTRTFGTILRDTSDLELALRVPLFGQYCISGLKEEWLDSSNSECQMIERHIDIYKNFLRPFVRDCRVFHHTPVLVGQNRSSWCVLEYAARDATRALAGVFKLDDSCSGEYHFVPKGLDPACDYRVKLDSAQQEMVLPAEQFLAKGIKVKLTATGHSELLLFEKTGN